MKLRRILCYILILLLNFSAIAQNKEHSGIELCNEVHSFLKKSGFSPESQSLVISGENTFPYNIIVRISPEQNTSPENILLVFFQEDIPKNQLLIRESLKKIQEAHYPFSVTALFAYGERQILEKSDMIYGTEIFLESINTNLSYTAVIFDLESKENIVETTANGLSSPPQLIKNSMNLYKTYGIGNKLPPFILSQISSYDFISTSVLGNFFDYNIPSIKLSLGDIPEEKKAATAGNIITGTVSLLSKDSDISWEHHFLIIKLFGSYHIISEIIILHIVIPTIFIWILFIFLLIFVNRRLKKHTWYTIGNIWWSVPVTYVIIVTGFFISGIFFNNVFPNASPAWKIYGRFLFQISISLFISLSFYLVILTLNYRFDERAVDYLIVISCFINQSLFILADISLSPIFIIICLLSLLALTVKNNALHIAVFLLMILPLIPYSHRMITASNLKDMSFYIEKSKGLLIVVPLVLYPVHIVLFRILTSVRSHTKSIKFLLLSTILTFSLIIISLTSLSLIRTKSLNHQQYVRPTVSMSALGNKLISLSVSDKNVFDDIIRTINVSLKQDCLLCDIIIYSDTMNPILYSDNDFSTINVNTARFRIPNNPPEKMSFSYGTQKGPSRITVSAVIKGEIEGDYQFISKSLDIGE